MQVPRTGTLGVLSSCDDELTSGILVGSCLVNMESKVPVWVLNVRDGRVCLVTGMHLGKVTEATNEIHVFANSEPEEKSSKGMTQLQRQALTKLLCEYEHVIFRK